MGDRFRIVPLCNCDGLLLSSGGRPQCRLDCRDAVTALEWLFASGVAVDLLVGRGAFYPAPRRAAPVPASRWGPKMAAKFSSNLHLQEGRLLNSMTE